MIQIIFKDCLEALKGKRTVRIVTLQEYCELEDQTVTEVAENEGEDMGFIVSDFFNNLGSYRDDTILVYSHTLDSTQTFIKTYCSDYQNIVCSTDIQTQGRGRTSNTWVSPVGCMMFSYNSAVQNHEFGGMIQYMDALVMCEAIKELKGADCIDVNIKWPNDVYVNRSQKICGILCQSIYMNGVFNVTSGIGVNVSNRKPTTCLEEQIKRKSGKVVHLSRAELLGHYMRIWNSYFPLFAKQGFTPFLERYYQLWLHSNQAVNVLKDDGGYSSVIIKGITPYGYLQAVSENGETLELLPDGNSFNFLDGLISKKVWRVCDKHIK